MIHHVSVYHYISIVYSSWMFLVVINQWQTNIPGAPSCSGFGEKSVGSRQSPQLFPSQQHHRCFHARSPCPTPKLPLDAVTMILEVKFIHDFMIFMRNCEDKKIPKGTTSLILPHDSPWFTSRLEHAPLAKLLAAGATSQSLVSDTPWIEMSEKWWRRLCAHSQMISWFITMCRRLNAQSMTLCGLCGYASPSTPYPAHAAMRKFCCARLKKKRSV